MDLADCQEVIKAADSSNLYFMNNATDCNNSTWGANFSRSNNGSSSSTSAGQPDGRSLLTLVLLMSYGTIATIGLLGNGLVILVILKYTKMKTVTNMYILNLSIADALFLTGLPLIMATFALEHWIFGFALCKLYYVTTCINMFTGTFTLTVMSGDRFLAVCYPIESLQYRTPKYARIAIALIWILSFIFMLPVVLYTQILPKGQTGQYSCTIKWPTQAETTGGNIFITYTLILGFVIPVVMISLLYTLLLIRLKTTGSQVRNVQRKSSRRKVTRLVTLIIAIFIICWLPYWVFQVFLITAPNGTMLPSWQVYIYHGFTMLSYSNSMINPLLYAFTNESFREAFISAFKCAADSVTRRNKKDLDRETNLQAEPLNTEFTKVATAEAMASSMDMVHVEGNGVNMSGTQNNNNTETRSFING